MNNLLIGLILIMIIGISSLFSLLLDSLTDFRYKWLEKVSFWLTVSMFVLIIVYLFTMLISLL